MVFIVVLHHFPMSSPIIHHFPTFFLWFPYGFPYIHGAFPVESPGGWLCCTDRHRRAGDWFPGQVAKARVVAAHIFY